MLDSQIFGGSLLIIAAVLPVSHQATLDGGYP